ncbi:MAG: hypothetical protein IJL31_07745, partial [Oscillospiraceae bacterium]|nr:hypothetical protein [Oscillospiraceae bacterium]
CSAQVWYFVRFFVCGDFLLPCMPACIPKRLSAVEIFAVSMFICGNSRKYTNNHPAICAFDRIAPFSCAGTPAPENGRKTAGTRSGCAFRRGSVQQ